MDGIVLAVGLRPGAVEDEVGRDLHELRPDVAARVGEVRDGLGVHLEGPRVRLAVVDLRERRAVDEDVGPQLAQRPRDPGWNP